MIRYAMVFISCLTIISACGSAAAPEVRPSVLAGHWYPSDKNELSALTTGLIARSEPGTFDQKPLIVILPHAGYSYSGAVAAAGYRALSSFTPGCVFIIGPSHRESFEGCAVNTVDFYETPLGKVKVARDITVKMSGEPHFSSLNAVFAKEHCIEIQLPFLQTIYGKRLENEIPIVPILTGDVHPTLIPSLAGTIAKYLSAAKDPLLIISSDFTHYGPRFGYLPFPANGELKKRLEALDGGAIDCILKKNTACFSKYASKTEITICGRNPIQIALSLPLKLGKTSLVKYDTSCNITGECEDSVSYAALLIGQDNNPSLSLNSVSIVIPEKDRRYLLQLARNNIRSHLVSHKALSVTESSVPLSCRENHGVFVTLKKNGQLRGCIGTIHGLRPLWQGIIDNSYHAAFSDPRFTPIQAQDLGALQIEISVLTEPRVIASPGEIVIGRDGIIIEMDGHRGLLLPQVATEFGWSVEEFLMHACIKAGLPGDAWRTGAVIYVFQALVFAEG